MQALMKKMDEMKIMNPFIGITYAVKFKLRYISSNNE